MTQPLPYQTYPPVPFDADRSHLKTLAICHYVWGGLAILFSSIFIIHIAMGLMMVRGSFPGARPGGPPPPPGFNNFGWVFVVMGSVFMLLGWTTGILSILSGRCLANQRSRTFSLVMAGINCMSVPIGTTLGVFTFIVLFRPSVQALYDQQKAYG